MPFGWHHVLAAVAVLFVLFLLVKMRPLGWGGAPRRKLAADIRAARERAHAATSPRDRAKALCEAGTLASRDARWTAAAGFFLRAMRTDPAWAGAPEQAIAALGRARPKLLEQILWRRLSHLPWDPEHRDAAHAMAKGLAHLYHGRIKDPSKAAVLERLASTLGPRQA